MPDRDPGTGRFLSGNTGCGDVRPRGARNKLGERFLADLAEDWSDHGVDAIRKCREEKQTDYVNVVAGLLPKELLLRKDPMDELTDDEIAD